ncbi:MAG: multicopper oxidase domain-containing protein [Deltaproteobacteria bacterium]|nr:multicopper oxidase domain-containing protein [Deltaproteobacteria bacterium]
MSSYPPRRLLHGVHFQVTGTDGGEVPLSARFPQATVIVPVGGVRVIEFLPEEPGDWAMHCHMAHHMMNQIGHAKPLFAGADTRHSSTSASKSLMVKGVRLNRSSSRPSRSMAIAASLQPRPLSFQTFVPGPRQRPAAATSAE